MHGRFSRRLFLYFAVTLLALAVGVGMATIIPLLNRLTRSEEAGLAHVAETQALAVGEWFHRAEDLARQITSRSQIREALEDLNESRITREYFANFARPKLVDAMQRSGDVAGITRLSLSGELLVSCGVPIPEEVWRIPPPDSGQLLVSAPQLLSGRRCIVIGAPILGRGGYRVGTDIVAVDTASLREKIIQPLHTDDSGSLALGCKGNAAARPFLVEPASRADAITPTIRQAMALALAGRTGMLSTPDAVVAYTPIADSGWGLTLSTNSRRLYAPVHAELLTMLAYTAAIYLLCLAGFGVLLRPLAGRMLLRADELAAVVEAKTRQLTTELTARAAAEKALQEARDELELRVNERTHRLAEANAELLALHERLQGEFEERKALSKELINLLEGMRLDLSRDLHDHTGQLLTTLRLHLNAALRAMPADEDGCRAQIESAEEKVNQMQREIKTIARGLRPDTLDYLGLTPSLEALLDEQRASSELNFHFFHNHVPADFDRDKALALYRIAQESISNIIRHAHAANVHVTLVRREQFLTLSVEDDGVGFDMTARAAGSQQPAMHLGLTLMRERMVQLGGTLQVESAPGQGAHVVAELEL
jgi:signal transduction histidine kinase